MRSFGMETFDVDGYPETKLVLASFKRVKNASDLKRKYLDRVALLDAGLLLSVFQLRVAAAMSVEKEKAGKMKTRSIPSEIVWSLSGSKNITSTLQTFCIQEVDDADLVVAAIGMDDDDLQSIMEDVKGEPCGLEELGKELGGRSVGVRGEGKSGAGNTGWERLEKLYKLTDDELAMNSLEDCIIMRMAVKDH